MPSLGRPRSRPLGAQADPTWPGVIGRAFLPAVAFLLVLAAIAPALQEEESGRVYEAVLRHLANEHPRTGFDLNVERVNAGCFPHCGEANYRDRVSPELVAGLLAKKLIAGVCTPAENQLGCGEPNRISVSFGALTWSEGGGATLEVYLFHPGPGVVGQGLLFDLKRGEEGEWQVVGKEYTWLT